MSDVPEVRKEYTTQESNVTDFAKPEPKFAQVDTRLLEGIVSYLQTRPYHEVKHLLKPFEPYLQQK